MNNPKIAIGLLDARMALNELIMQLNASHISEFGDAGYQRRIESIASKLNDGLNRIEALESTALFSESEVGKEI